MTEAILYTTQLQAGLGLVDETKELLDLWVAGMTASQLHQLALTSGRFPNVTARRLRNIVSECFAPRYLISNGAPAKCLKQLSGGIPAADLTQIMLIYTARANLILGDFIRTVFWPRYAGGYAEITNDDARAFVERAIDDGKTSIRWSESTVRRISAYLTGCCADYGLLSGGARSARRIHPLRISPAASAYLAYDLHLAGVGDNALLTHPDWQLFGLAKDDVLDELKRLSLKGHLIVQIAGDVVRISAQNAALDTADYVISELYELSTLEWTTDFVDSIPNQDVSGSSVEGGSAGFDVSAALTDAEVASKILSYSVGVVFGRWHTSPDVSSETADALKSSVAPLPSLPPGAKGSAQAMAARVSVLSTQALGR